MSSPWEALAAPFPPEAVKERQGPKQHQGACEKQYGQCKHPHKMLSYVDARDVETRLDEVLTPAGWDFQATIVADPVVQGRLIVYQDGRAITREDFGYPNGDDDAEPIKSAVSDALKRCGVQLGIGRHLYTDNKAPRRAPRAAQAAPQTAQNGHQRPEPRPVASALVPAVAGAVQPMQMGEAMQALEGVDKKAISAAGKELFGTWSLKEMTPIQRGQLVAHLRGGASAPTPRPAATAPAGPDDLWEGMPQ